jgi:hypothetical protein
MHDIALHPFLSRVLALEGGTPLNPAFGPPTRLSVDLDFNYIGQVDREAIRLDSQPSLELGGNSRGCVRFSSLGNRRPIDLLPDGRVEQLIGMFKVGVPV